MPSIGAGVGSTQVPVSQVLLEMSGIERLAAGSHGELFGTIEAASFPDVATQPLMNRCKLALADLRIEVWVRRPDRSKPLGRVHGPQRVAREIADQAFWPVDVLQAALSMLFTHLQPEEMAHGLFPAAGNVLDGHAAFHEVAFDAVAQDDVGGVADFVGLDPDEARLDLGVEADLAPDAVRRQAGQERVGDMAADDRDAASGDGIDADRRYAYEPERGPVESARGQGDLVVSGQTLLDMAADNYEDARTREEARRLMRSLIADRLGGQMLHTRTVLSELQDL